MVLSRNFHPLRVLSYVRTEVLFSVLTVSAVYLIHKFKLADVSFSFSISAILGSALAIFTAFRNNTAYSRWWEARTVWGNIINNSRIFARVLLTCIDSADRTKISSERTLTFIKESVYRQIAFAHSLRSALRRLPNDLSYKNFLSKSEAEDAEKSINVPNRILLLQSIYLKRAVSEGLIGPFDMISLENILSGFNNLQGACERIKNTPLLRQYDFFTRVFLYCFMLVLPLSLIGEFKRLEWDFLFIPVTVMICFIFSIIGKVGEVNEDPFENRVTDVPLDALCNTIERDLKEMTGEKNIPAKNDPVNGILM